MTTKDQAEPVASEVYREDDELAAAIQLVQQELGGVVVWAGRPVSPPDDTPDHCHQSEYTCRAG